MFSHIKKEHLIEIESVVRKVKSLLEKLESFDVAGGGTLTNKNFSSVGPSFAGRICLILEKK